MKTKFSLLFSVLLIASMVLAACGGGQPAATEAPPQVEEPTATEEPAATEEPTATEEPAVEPAGTLRIWADDTRAPISKIWRMKYSRPITSSWLSN